jgi:hypothetical protein
VAEEKVGLAGCYVLGLAHVGVGARPRCVAVVWFISLVPITDGDME